MNADRIFNTAIKARKTRKPCLEFIRQYGVSFNELEILNVIFLKKSMTPAEISDALYIERAIVSRKLKILVDKNLVTYKPNALDRRMVDIEITKEGKKLTKLLLKTINNSPTG